MGKAHVINVIIFSENRSGKAGFVMVQTPYLIEPFRNQPTPTKVRSCILNAIVFSRSLSYNHDQKPI
jgi:hypothetical protein